MPRILVTNDDGVHSDGIHVLAAALRPLGDIVVVAPHIEASAIGHALTLRRPLRLERLRDGVYEVDGTPTDCVNIGITKLFAPGLPDLVVSGINKGLNIGDDVTYSGTVSGALEGALLGIPSIAVSLVGKEFKHYAAAARVAHDLVQRLARAPFGAPVLLNVNVPDVPYESLAGIEVTRLGRRHKAQPVVAGKNPRGETVYWVGPAGAAREAGPGTDFHALERGAVSVTPLQVDLTHAQQIPPVAAWILT